MSVTSQSHPSHAIYLDATAPLLQPRELSRRLPAVQAGGIDALLTSAGAIEDFRTTMEVIGKWLEIERSGSQKIRIARSVSDIRAAKRAGETAMVLHFQGADPIEDELDFINVFHAAGLRVMQLTYNARNRLGDGCFEPTDAGLSKFGKQVIRRMEALRVAVDLAHAGNRTALETTEVATRPVVVTHANARALMDTPRNVPDDLIKAVAASGGVIGICAVPFFLTRVGQPTLEMLIDHAAYVADLVGIAHVGLGFDFAEEDADDYIYYGYDERYVPMPPWQFPIGISSHAEAGNVASALRARGFSASDVTNVLGENFLRVFAEIWGA
ncbi:dipeptidase [Dongia deserti]|uniref:dipeptidase n=1 Tax=Dongia deserti TaxID=2268030 RepID=UPI000E65055A|nr:membrane dipeptidase [Dongia deserti]